MRFVLLLAAIIGTTVLPQERALSQNSADRVQLERCKAIPEAADRLRCYEDLTPQRPHDPTPFPQDPGASWRIVRTPRQDGGGDFISMMRTADTLRSDPDFAGLAIHCGQNGPELILVIIQPLPPRSHPQVTLGNPDSAIRVTASILPSGATLLLPEEATALAKGPWQSMADLPITVESGATKIHGVVRLDGLGAALQTLSVSCPTKN